MVYGFVKQSGGHVRIYSEPEHGTTASLYLPIVARPGEAAARTEEPPHSMAGKGQLVLVVEDNAQIRRLSATSLMALGYATVEAEDGPSALAILDREARVEVLFSDVVLPGGMNGFDLAREAKRRRPDLKVLHATGFADRDALSGDGSDTGAEILHKPFRRVELGQRMAELFRFNEA